MHTLAEALLYYVECQALKGPLTGVLLCCSVHQVLKCPSWLEFFTVAWCVWSLNGHIPWGPFLLLGASRTKARPRPPPAPTRFGSFPTALLVRGIRGPPAWGPSLLLGTLSA